MLLKKILEVHRADKVNWEAVLTHALSQIGHSNGEVRTAAYGVILELYGQVGKKITSEFIDLRPQ